MILLKFEIFSPNDQKFISCVSYSGSFLWVGQPKENPSVSGMLPQDHHELLVCTLKIHITASLIHGGFNILASPTH